MTPLLVLTPGMQHTICWLTPRRLIEEIRYMLFFEGIMKSLLITWWILSLSLLSLSLGRQNVPWTAAHFVALGRQFMQGVTKYAVKATRFVVDDKLCRGDKMCRNKPSFVFITSMIFAESKLIVVSHASETEVTRQLSNINNKHTRFIWFKHILFMTGQDKWYGTTSPM